MKNHLTILLFASLLWACNDTLIEKEEAVSVAEALHRHDDAPTLALNNEAKWKADENTNRNVAELEAVAGRFNRKESKIVADYAAAGNEWKTGLDKMIKECRMKGADHDALHKWLEPLLKKVNSLQQATTKVEASKLYNEICGQLSVYHQYFA